MAAGEAVEEGVGGEESNVAMGTAKRHTNNGSSIPCPRMFSSGNLWVLLTLANCHISILSIRVRLIEW